MISTSNKGRMPGVTKKGGPMKFGLERKVEWNQQRKVECIPPHETGQRPESSRAANKLLEEMKIDSPTETQEPPLQAC